MTTPDNTTPNESPEKKGKACETKCCGKGSCELKLNPLCCMIKIAVVLGIAVFAIQYFMK